jgi:hypothetical protein
MFCSAALDAAYLEQQKRNFRSSFCVAIRHLTQRRLGASL